MRTKVVVLGLIALCLSATSVGASEDLRPAAIDREASCSSTSTLAPEHHEVPVVGDYTTPLDLDVHVLLVGVDPGYAELVFNHVARVYAPINILVKPVFEEVSLEIDPPPDTSAASPILSTSESGAYIQASKDHFGGYRPAHADVVYTMLSGEISSSVAGQADCVGGIAYPDAAFAVGESGADSLSGQRRSAKIAAHEIAHLLAAHHHFANCAQGDPNDIAQYATPCTLMFNDIGLISLKFSTLEAAVVRRWGLDYLQGESVPPPPPEEPETRYVDRSVTLEVNRKGLATGSVGFTRDGGESCAQEVPLVVQRKKKARWRPFDTTVTDIDSQFTYRIEGPGTYRIRATELETEDGFTCGKADSPAVRVG